MATPAGNEISVLVIDDEESMREGCRQLLEEEGYEASVASNGEEGLRLAAQLRPAVVLLDLKMPGIDGMEVLTRLRKLNPGVLPIIMTGYGSTDSAVKAMKSGACDYLNKPFDDRVLLEAIHRGLRDDQRKGQAAKVTPDQSSRDDLLAALCQQIKSEIAAATRSIENATARADDPLTSHQRESLRRAWERLKHADRLTCRWQQLVQTDAGRFGGDVAPEGLLDTVETLLRRLTERCGASLRADRLPGQGATFAVTLPGTTGMSGPAVVEPARKPELLPVTIKILTAGQLRDFVDALLADHEVVGVKRKEGTSHRYVFGPLSASSELCLDYDVTLLPPKKYLLPARETLVDFVLGRSPLAEPHVAEPDPKVLIGIHPYDMIAINQLDRLMAEGQPDPGYRARRAELTVIGVDPVRTHDRAFWVAMGCGFARDGFDLWLTDLGHGYTVEVATERGRALLETCAEARDATKDELVARARRRAKLLEMGSATCGFRPEDLPGLLRRSFDHGIWRENARKCLSCGSCNLVCPTCYCFDVRDRVEISLTRGERYRVWDGCVLKDFAQVASGENFRETRAQRYRHRFYRKGMYLYERYGHIACVGCGRCALACLSDIADPVGVFNALMGKTV